MNTQTLKLQAAALEGKGTAATDWSISRIAAHQLLPGLASLVAFVPLLWALTGTGIPRMAALFLAILIGEVPMSWYLMIRSQRADGQTLSMQHLFPWHAPMGFWRLGLLGFGLAIAGMVIIFGLATAAEPFIRETLFSWVPEGFVLQAGPAGMEGATRTGLLVLWALSGLVGVGIGGVTQELYSRGFLLPRSAHLGWMSVPLNAGLFAMMHLAAPWGWPFFFFGALLWGAAVYRWRSIQLGLAGHIGMLALGWLMMTGMVFGFIPAP